MIGITLSGSENRAKWLADGITASSVGDELDDLNGVLQADKIVISEPGIYAGNLYR